MDKPLDGVRVLDLSRYIAGPFCSQILGDMGADVIKVEKPEGADSRHLPPYLKGESIFTQTYNRNKRGITLNLRKQQAKNIFRDLVKWSDVIVENFRPGTMNKIGFDFDKIKEINSRAILVSVSGFGQTGPDSHKACFDAIAQAKSGLMSMTGREEDPPLLSGTFIADYSAALYSVIGTVLALRYRDKTGKGQHVDVALLDSIFSLLTTAVPEYFELNREPSRIGNRDPFSAPVNSYKAKDGYVYIAAANNSLWERLARAMGKEELLEDSKFETNNKRMENYKELNAIIQNWISKLSKEEAIKIIEEAGVPCAPVCEFSEAVENPQLKFREQIVDVEHPKLGSIKLSGLPIKLSDSPGEIKKSAPLLGEDNIKFYTEELSYSKVEIEKWKEQGII